MPGTRRLLILATLVAALGLGMPLETPAQDVHASESRGGPKKPTRKRRGARLEAPPLTAEGVFTGTWRRVAPGERQALHLRRGEDDQWELRLYWTAGSTFQLDTQWETRHEMLVQGYPSFIEIRVDPERSSDERIIASYRREAEGQRGSKLVETGTLEIFRATRGGRLLVWQIEPLHREVTVADPLYPDEARHQEDSRQIWIMEKIANRLVPWDDIPW
ncbi:MAG: hypothetical protein Q9Q40_02740 [Acidobacteriota bacterium]|nr:hypothetical protein [Acidobacteriota bacterium]MDQ7088842.1 hypothetical protein [Acidobacteriota bacterium]